MSRYPRKIETLVESEEILSSMNIVGGEYLIEKEYNNKIYIIQWICYQVRGCLVFDLNENLIDYYDNCALLTDKMYKNKTYYQWLGIDMFKEDGE